MGKSNHDSSIIGCCGGRLWWWWWWWCLASVTHFEFGLVNRRSSSYLDSISLICVPAFIFKLVLPLSFASLLPVHTVDLSTSNYVQYGDHGRWPSCQSCQPIWRRRSSSKRELTISSLGAVRITLMPVDRWATNLNFHAL